MDDRSAKKSTNNMWDKLKNTTTAMKYARAKFMTGKKDKSGESTSFATRASFGTAASSLRVVRMRS